MNAKYSYSFDLDDGMITEETMDAATPYTSPMRSVGITPPVFFDDYVDVWKTYCHPVFIHRNDEKKLTLRYLCEIYSKGMSSFELKIEHNPLKNTFSSKYTNVKITFQKDETTDKVRANVVWQDDSSLE